MQRMNPPRGMGPMGPGPQVSPLPKHILQSMGTTSWGSEGWEIPPHTHPVPPLVLMHFTLVLHLEIPPLNRSEVFRAH